MNEEQYRQALKVDALLDYTLRITRLIGSGLKDVRIQDTIKPMIDTVLSKLDDIDRADFGDNFNGDHGKETGRPF